MLAVLQNIILKETCTTLLQFNQRHQWQGTFTPSHKQAFGIPRTDNKHLLRTVLGIKFTTKGHSSWKVILLRKIFLTEFAWIYQCSQTLCGENRETQLNQTHHKISSDCTLNLKEDHRFLAFFEISCSPYVKTRNRIRHRNITHPRTVHNVVTVLRVNKYHALTSVGGVNNSKPVTMSLKYCLIIHIMDKYTYIASWLEGGQEDDDLSAKSSSAQRE